MKKIRIIAAAIMRGALLITPGVAFALWQWAKVSALVNILASVGLECIFLFVFAFLKVAFDVARNRAEPADAQHDTPTAEDLSI